MRRSEYRKSGMSGFTKGLLWFISIIFILALLAIAYVAFKIYAVGGSIHNPLDRDKSELRSKNINLKDGDPFTIALFGVDSNADRKNSGAGERSDSIMVLSLNPNKKTTEIVSIPRDTQAEIVGRGTTEKINHAYAYGGADMAVKSLEKLMGIPIDHYATVDMDGMKNMVDIIDGVDVVSNATFTMDGHQFVKGQRAHLNGEEAMSFIRSRKESGAGGDFGRQERQQLVLQAIANKLTGITSVTNFNGIMNQVKDSVQTDLTIGDLNTIRSNYSDANETVNRHQLDGQGGIQGDGLYYFVPNPGSLDEIANIFKNNLEIN